MSEQRPCAHCGDAGDTRTLMPYYIGRGDDGKPIYAWLHPYPRPCSREWHQARKA